ncbi:MAG: hypothetical protein P8Z00_08480 [Anaerolineales bacterium]|jgi:hypothetical protein
MGRPYKVVPQGGSMGFVLGGSRVGATRHLPTDVFSGIQPVLKDALAGLVGRPYKVVPPDRWVSCWVTVG